MALEYSKRHPIPTGRTTPKDRRDKAMSNNHDFNYKQRPATPEYYDGYERIFGKKRKQFERNVIEFKQAKKGQSHDYARSD